ncbi:MAG TPA: tRNA preQ1(34) S-adenosylmethionine ribosyltransferase-isomerase QueA [Bacillota bacterium]|nr:tRNA preQ1(34) S-adenosylmethionine ribosyltransferase-isomerase QueA [Bacillota bacterium]
MKLSDFDYYLPQELIAQEPLARRDHSRMLVLDRRKAAQEHSYFYRLPENLNPGDLLVLNNTRVIPARLVGQRAEGGEAELLLLHRHDRDRWTAMVRPGRKLKPGAVVYFKYGLEAVIEDYAAEGQRLVRFRGPESTELLLQRNGQVPLPPYITAPLRDPEHYQTIYASIEGSAAAPTAGFHFTEEVFDHLSKKGINWSFITLHIGPGTFQPVKVEDIRQHRMHREFYRIDEETARQINESRRRGGRVVAVGTTACRVLETAASSDGVVQPQEGWTELFIYPGYRFRAVDALLTNFHLPRSTLLMLVSALAGRTRILEAYREAVEQRYRFYSFGDCMLIL